MFSDKGLEGLANLAVRIPEKFDNEAATEVGFDEPFGCGDDAIVCSKGSLVNLREVFQFLVITVEFGEGLEPFIPGCHTPELGWLGVLPEDFDTVIRVLWVDITRALGAFGKGGFV